jgi:mono/diheme cytochrome c family protein
VPTHLAQWDEELMKPELRVPALAPIIMIAFSLAAAMPVAAQQTSTAPNQPAPSEGELDVNQVFASTCGWCHSDGGRAAGKGPQLMHSQRTDDFIRERIKTGKPGSMPAFGEVFDDKQIDAIVKYIRDLKPDQG